MCVWVKSSHILCCNIFHFHEFLRYFWPNFRSHDLMSFLSIFSVSLGARMSLIIYLEPWSESIALAHLIWRVSPVSPKTYILWVHLKSEGKSLDLEKSSLRTCSLYWGDHCVQISSNLVSCSSRIKVEKKVYGWTGHIPPFSRYIQQRPDISSPRSDMSVEEFSARCLFTVLTIFCQPSVQLIPFFFRCIHNFEGIISTLLIGVFITFL
jgi:hypothetical protein